MAVQYNNSTIPLLDAGGSLNIPPGGSETVNGALYFQPQADWTRLDTVCNFVGRAEARFQQVDKWNFHQRPNLLWEHLDSKLAPLD
jgi:hypothetical protein